MFSGVCVCLFCHRKRAPGRTLPLHMLQMVRTLAHFSISLEEMNEHGENAGDEGGEKDGGEDLVYPFRDKRKEITHVNLDGNRLCAGSPNGEV